LSAELRGAEDSDLNPTACSTSATSPRGPPLIEEFERRREETVAQVVQCLGDGSTPLAAASA
jgi:hypothetical protein